MKTMKDQQGLPGTCIVFLLQHLSSLPDLRPSLPKYSIQQFDVIMSLH